MRPWVQKQTLQSQMFVQLFRVRDSAVCLFYPMWFSKVKTVKGTCHYTLVCRAIS